MSAGLGVLLGEYFKSYLIEMVDEMASSWSDMAPCKFRTEFHFFK
jgi:hypothetical protein